MRNCSTDFRLEKEDDRFSEEVKYPESVLKLLEEDTVWQCKGTTSEACLVQIKFPLSTNHISQNEGACFAAWLALREVLLPLMQLRSIT